MAWKILGLIEGRSGSITVMPDWAIGAPNDFAHHSDAATIRDAMAQAVAKEKTTVRYVIVPAVDDALLQQMRASSQPQPAPQIAHLFAKPPAAQ
jgi:hypothetical protein